jgi:hypothetical protein
MLADILSHIEGFSAMSAAIAPDLGLSDQAISILKLIAQSKTAQLFIPPAGEGQMFVDSAVYAAAVPRFLHDDLDSLVAHGLFSPAHTAHGETYWRLTRQGARFVELLPTDSKEEVDDSVKPGPRYRGFTDADLDPPETYEEGN